MVYKRPGEIPPEPLIIADRELVEYTDGYMLDDSMFRQEVTGRGAKMRPTGRLQPNFNTSETARVFFGKQSDWLRWRIKSGHFVLDGAALGIKRDPDTGFRYFTLADIERMTHALGRMGALTGAEMTTTLIIVRSIAKLYGIIR